MQHNLIFVLSDQHRYDATGFAGDPNVATPTMDSMARDYLSCGNAVSTVPVCSPARASLLTGLYPLHHGVIVNDVYLKPRTPSIADALAASGYETGYIGKWHLDGRAWSQPIEQDRRLGFQYWKVCECSHDYFAGSYFDEENQRNQWEGYDATAQTRMAQQFLRDRAKGAAPFALFLAWGPPHDPYRDCPPGHLASYESMELELRGNVPLALHDKVRPLLAGYYAHITAIDALLGELEQTLIHEGLADNTLLVYTSDHGVMLGSHGGMTKEQPWDESARVPFLARHPSLRGASVAAQRVPFGSVDVMPTLLDLLGVPVPDEVQGTSVAPVFRGEQVRTDRVASIECVQPFGSWGKLHGGREFRGLRTERHTYVEDLNGPWLLYDNLEDPLQIDNLVGDPESATIMAGLRKRLARELAARHDDFKPGEHYMEALGYEMNETGRVPVKH